MMSGLAVDVETIDPVDVLAVPLVAPPADPLVALVI
jgi:hypothetical protein